MKKLLGILVLIGALFVLYYVYTNPTSTELNNNEPETGQFAPDPSSATFTFDDGPVTLSDGRGERKDSGLVADEIRLLEEKASGDINGDDKLDSVVFLARSGRGSGVFVYVAAFVSGPISYKGSSAIYLGDRISPQSLSVENEVVTAVYLDRHPDEAFAAEPTVSTTKQFVYRNGAFVER